MKKIEDIKEKNPFKIPDNYFEEVKRKILASTVEADSASITQSFFRKMRPFLLAAASVSILVILTYTGIKLFSGRENEHLLPKIAAKEYTEFLFNDIDLSALEEGAAAAGLPYLEPEMDNQEIINYLMLDNIDINLLEEQL